MTVRTRARANVLLSSAGRRVGLVRLFKEALRDLGLSGEVVAADVSPQASAACHSADVSCIVPRCTDPAFPDELLAICERHDVGLVVPTIDTELPVFAAERERFLSAGTSLLISSEETVRIACDKVATNGWLLAHNFPTPRQTTVVEALADRAAWPLPLIAKPRYGSASLGVEKVVDEGALHRLEHKFDYVIQTVAPGDEHTVDVLVDQRGRVLCAVPRRRLEVRAGEISKGVTVRSRDLQGLATAIAERLPGAYGPLNIQIFASPQTRELTIVEINARFGGGFPLSARAGANYPKWILEELLDRPTSARPDGWQDGLGMLRYDAEIFFDMEAVPPAAAVGTHALSRS